MAALGRVVVHSAHVEHGLAGLLAAATSADADRAHVLILGQNAAWVRERLETLANIYVADIALRERLRELLTDVKSLSVRRNHVAHGLHVGSATVIKPQRTIKRGLEAWGTEVTTQDLTEVGDGFLSAAVELDALIPALTAAGLFLAEPFGAE